MKNTMKVWQPQDNNMSIESATVYLNLKVLHLSSIFPMLLTQLDLVDIYQSIKIMAN